MSKPNAGNESAEMDFWSHFAALRPHLVRGAAAVVVIAVAAFLARHFLIDVVLFGPKSAGFPTNRLLLEEYKRLQVQLQMSMVGAAGEMPSEDMQRFQQLASLLYMNSDVQAYLMAEMQMQKTLADIFKILTEAAGIRFDVPEKP